MIGVEPELSNYMGEQAKLIQDLLLQAVEIEDSEKRKAFLATACGGNARLLRELEELLKAHSAASQFLPSTPDQQTPSSEGPVAAKMPLEKAGDRIGRYKLLQKIGEGGCGVVYMAEQEEPVRRKVALKVIKLGMDTKSVVARFEAERQALALMDHTNIARVLDAGATETGRPFFVMELVRGIEITDYCDENELSTSQRLELFIQVCQAVQHAHQKGIIHRDLKPSNILVTVNDDVPVPKVIDFGIAKATGGRLTDHTLFTAFEQFLGTPDYMSPEQAAMTSLDIDTRSDIYSLGVLLYELLTGKTPFDTKALLAAGLDEVRRVIREKEPVRPSTRVSTMLEEERTTTAKRRQTQAPKLINLLRGDLDWIVMKCLEKDRKRRYETASGLARDIQRHLNNEPVVARPPSRLYEFQKTVRRHKLGFAAAGAVMAALAAGALVSAWQAVEKEHERQRFQSNVLRQYVANGTRLVNEGDLFGGLLWYTEALRLDAGDKQREEPHRTRIASVLQQCPKLLNVFSHGKMLYHSEFSPDGSRVLTSSDDHTARVWDTVTGQQLLLLQHDDEVYDARFSSNGLLIVTSSQDYTARVWDARNGALICTLKHDCVVWNSCFSPDGKLVATACENGTAQLWEPMTGKKIGNPLRHEQAVRRVSFGPDGHWLASLTTGARARVWSVAEGSVRLECVNMTDTVCPLNFSPDGRLFINADFDGLHVRDTNNFQDVFPPLTLPDIFSAVFSPDGRYIIAASLQFTAQVWDATTGKPLFSQPVQHMDRVLSARISPDSRLFATACQDGTARLWNLGTGQPIGPPLKFILHVKQLDFSPDGRRLLGNSCDQAARVWDLATSEAPPFALPAFPNQRQIFSPDWKRAVLAGNSNVIWITDLVSRTNLIPLAHPSVGTYASFSGDGKTVITACERLTAVSSMQNDIFLWDANSGNRLNQQKMSHAFAVLYAAFSPDNRRLLTCGFDFTARLWDAGTGKPLSGLLRHHGPVWWGAFSSNGNYVVTASSDRTVRVWEAANGNPVTPPLQHKSPVDRAAWTHDGKRLVTVTLDDFLQVWDLALGEPLTPPRKVRGTTPDSELPRESQTRGEEQLPQDDRPVADLALLGQMLAVSRIDNSGNIVPLRLEELTEAWHFLHGRYTNEFTATPSEIVAWHRRQSQESSQEGNQVAAAFHRERAESASSIPGQTSATPSNQPKKSPSAQTGGPRRPAPRDPGAGPEQIDLSNYYDSGIGDFDFLRERLQTLGEVQFDMRGVVHLNGQMAKADGAQFPESILGIPVGRKCDRLHFLQATGWDAPNGTVVGRYVLHYKDGEQRSLDLVFGHDLLNWWWGVPNLAGGSEPALPVWSGTSEDARRYGCSLFLYLSTRENPLPDVDLDKIDFVSTMSPAAPFLVALTLGTGPQWKERTTVQTQARQLVAQALVRSGVFPARDPRAGPKQIDLTTCYTSPMHGPRTDFGSFKEGLQSLGGVLFDARGVIYLTGLMAKRAGSTDPESVNGLLIGMKCRQLHFLQATGWDYTADCSVGHYVLHYEGGLTEKLPIIARRDTWNWWVPRIPPAPCMPGDAVPVWVGRNRAAADAGASLYLYKSTRANPHPELELLSIDFCSDMALAAPFLVALTVE